MTKSQRNFGNKLPSFRYVIYAISFRMVLQLSLLAGLLKLQHFEALVEEHFTHRSHHILSACKAYLDGAQVGHADACREAADKCHNSCSTGFKIMLAKLLPKLVSAFTERGIDCTQFLDVLN